MARLLLVVLLLGACRYGFVDKHDAALNDGATNDGRVDVDALAGKNLVFVTSAAYMHPAIRARGGGDMLLGGDTICAEAALAGGLPGTYRALLSTGSVNAIDRLTGRGWYRLDGLPFADSLASLFGTRAVLYPALYSELGTPLTTTQIMTGTNGAGVARDHCNNWGTTATNMVITTGNSTDGMDGWIERYIPDCSSTLRLYCFGIGNDVPVVLPLPDARRAFVSTPWQPGSGIAGADAHCQADANANSVPGTYRAFLASAAASAASRFTTGTKGWARLDGVMIADSPAALAARNIRAALTLRADGTHYGNVVWAGGGNPDGLATVNCTDWTINLATLTGQLAVASSGPNTFFNETYTAACNTSQPLYCFEI